MSQTQARKTAKKNYAKKVAGRATQGFSSLPCNSLRDYYDIVGLASNCTSREIKLAYFEQARRYHPDRRRRNTALCQGKEWTELRMAYSCLSDPAQRARYNKSRSMRAFLVRFYEQYNPANLTEERIHSILQKWEGKEYMLLHELHDKYDIKGAVYVDFQVAGVNCPVSAGCVTQKATEDVVWVDARPALALCVHDDNIKEHEAKNAVTMKPNTKDRTPYPTKQIDVSSSDGNRRQGVCGEMTVLRSSPGCVESAAILQASATSISRSNAHTDCTEGGGRVGSVGLRATQECAERRTAYFAAIRRSTTCSEKENMLYRTLRAEKQSAKIRKQMRALVCGRSNNDNNNNRNSNRQHHQKPLPSCGCRCDAGLSSLLASYTPLKQHGRQGANPCLPRPYQTGQRRRILAARKTKNIACS
jgi:hypothetical protein